LVKTPGLEIGTKQAELELYYPTRYKDVRLPEAYERLILDVFKGDHSQFVRADELEEAWKIFTPVLHELEQKKVAPHMYTFGTRGPAASDQLLVKHGFLHYPNSYEWTAHEARM